MNYFNPLAAVVYATALVLGACSEEDDFEPLEDDPNGLFSISELQVAKPKDQKNPNVAKPKDKVNPNVKVKRVHDGYFKRLSEFPIYLSAKRGVTFEVRNVSGKGTPLLQLLDRNGRRIAGTSANSKRIKFISPRSSSYRLVVYAKNARSAGTLDLYLDGRSWRTGVSFGGLSLSLNALAKSETLTTVQVPGGAGARHVMYVLDRDGSISLRRSGGGAAGAISYKLPSSLGKRTVILGVYGRSTWEGNARLVRNDFAIANHDVDNDGLGDALEAALGTCSKLSGSAAKDGVSFDCSLATDPRDTDGDGISDLWEVVGRFDMTPHQLLPLWGADPRHKDIFYEVDFMQREPGEAEIRFSATRAREFAAYYANEKGSTNPLRQLYVAETLLNPDAKPGINVHMDTGIDPTDATETTFGDWGGFELVPYVTNDNGTTGGADYKTAWETHMAVSRRGIFRYALAYANGGGQSGNGFACAFPMNSAWVAAHECGHANGLGHSGPPYAAPADVNCKPNYPSLMNYAFNDGSVGFSDGLGVPPINNWAVSEFEFTDPDNTVFLDVLEDKFRYYVDRTSGHVDWNRDGRIAPEGQTVRAYANFRPGGSCEYTRYNTTPVEGLASTQPPALERLGNRTFAFASVLGPIKYASSNSSFWCPEPAVTSCGTFNYPEWVYQDAHQGFDVVKVGYGSSQALLIVSIDYAGQLWQQRLTLSRSGEVFSGAIPIDGSHAAQGAPALQRIDGQAYLVYLGTDGYLYMNRTLPSGAWAGEEQLQTNMGSAIAMEDYASPALVRTYLPHRPGIPGLYGAFADSYGYLDLYYFNPLTGFWEKTNDLETRPRVQGRPTLAYVPYQSYAEYPGRTYLGYTRYTTSGDPAYRFMMSYVKMTGNTPVEKVGLDSYFDNVWFKGAGFDFLYEPTKDSNLRALVVGKDHKLYLRPKADGIQDLSYINYNDWQVLRVRTCTNVVNPGGTVTNPITCPTRDW